MHATTRNSVKTGNDVQGSVNLLLHNCTQGLAARLEIHSVRNTGQMLPRMPRLGTNDVNRTGRISAS